MYRKLLQHLEELFKRIKIVIFFLIVFLLFYMIIGFHISNLYGLYLPIPYISIFSSSAIEFLKFVLNSEIPKGLLVINVNVYGPILADITADLFLAILTTSPLITYEILLFVYPGLRKKERKTLRNALLPAVILFFAGVFISFKFLIPFILKAVLLFAKAMSIQPTISISSFISMALWFTVGVGIAFELPVIMAGLTSAGIVRYSTWKRYWRYGILVSFVIALVISPGTSGGLIELTIGFIFSGLYLSGIVAAKFIERKINNREARKEK
ncbi:MAG: twin-arginine translocase subunit TatC [Candidatus Parvarchaeum sp.]